MKISTVIPTWNRAMQICDAIESVKNQTMVVAEIIVVDDGSTDGTAELLQERHPDIRLIKQSNEGVSSARNSGIRAAKGDWIALLDSDDTWLPHKLQRQTDYIRSHAELRLVHCDEIWVRNGVRVNPKKKHQKCGGWIFSHCLPLCAISPSAVLIRSDVFDTIGYFDENLPACEDYDYWLRFCAHEPVGYIDELLLTKTGGHEDQLSRRHWGMDRFRMQALAKAINSGKLSAAQLNQSRGQLKEKLDIFLLGATKRNTLAAATALAELYQPLIEGTLD